MKLDVRARSNSLLGVAFTANIFEWYGFSLTAFMAADIGRIFFPVASKEAALTFSFSVFASSYLARPFGSLFFGAVGNRWGTGTALKLSMIGMAAPASLIAFLPTYQTAGYFSTTLLVCLKMLQGFAAGGETPLSGYFVSLNARNENRGLYSAFVVVSGFIGMLLASGVVFVVPYCAAVLSWMLHRPMTESWRWPFLFCAPLSLWIYSIRSSIPVRANDEEDCTLRRRSVLPLMQALVLVAFMEIFIYTVFIWLPSYLHSYLNVPTFDAGLINVIALTIFSLSMIVAGYAIRWIAASVLVSIGIGSLVVSTYPLFVLLQTGSFFTILCTQAAFAVMAGCLVGVIFVVLSDLFKDSWRSLGMASTYSIATAIFGGTAPVVSAYLIGATHLLTAPALYITAMGALAFPVACHVALQRRRKSAVLSIRLSKSNDLGRS